MTGAHTGEHMADILYNVLERFSITKRLLCIITDNAGNNGTIWKELEELLNNLDINNCWIRSVVNGGIVIIIVTLESWGGLV